MYRFGVVVLYAIIFLAACGAAWLGGMSRRQWMPMAAFWTTLITLTGIAAICGVTLDIE